MLGVAAIWTRRAATVAGASPPRGIRTVRINVAIYDIELVEFCWIVVAVVEITSCCTGSLLAIYRFFVRLSE